MTSKYGFGAPKEPDPERERTELLSTVAASHNDLVLAILEDFGEQNLSESRVRPVTRGYRNYPGWWDVVAEAQLIRGKRRPRQEVRVRLSITDERGPELNIELGNHVRYSEMQKLRDVLERVTTLPTRLPDAGTFLPG